MNDEIVEKIKKFEKGSDYLISVGESREFYTIYSEELKQFLWNIITNHVLPRCFESFKKEGSSIDGGYFSYEGGVGELPDRFTAVVGWEKKMEQKIKDNLEQRKREIKKKKQNSQEDEIKSLEFHFRRWEGGKIAEVRSEIFTRSFEDSGNSSPQIQEITDKKENEKTKQTSERKEKGTKQDNKESFNSVPTSIGKVMTGTIGIVGALSIMFCLATK